MATDINMTTGEDTATSGSVATYGNMAIKGDMATGGNSATAEKIITDGNMAIDENTIYNRREYGDNVPRHFHSSGIIYIWSCDVDKVSAGTIALGESHLLVVNGDLIEPSSKTRSPRNSMAAVFRHVWKISV